MIEGRREKRRSEKVVKERKREKTTKDIEKETRAKEGKQREQR